MMDSEKKQTHGTQMVMAMTRQTLTKGQHHGDIHIAVMMAQARHKKGTQVGHMVVTVISKQNDSLR
jgi:hypothetical protein